MTLLYPTASTKHSELANLQYGLAEVLPVKHSHESLWSVLDTLSDALQRLEGAILEPLLDILLVSFRVLGTHVLVGDDEPTHRQPFGHDLHQVCYTVGFVGWLVVLADHAASDDPAECIDVGYRGLELLAADLQRRGQRTIVNTGSFVLTFS